MQMLKLLFQKLQIKPILAPGKNSRPPGALLRITAWGQVEASVPLCSRERQRTTCPWEQLTAQDKNAAVSFTTFSLNFKTLTSSCLFPAIKMLAWKENVRWFS